MRTFPSIQLFYYSIQKSLGLSIAEEWREWRYSAFFLTNHAYPRAQEVPKVYDMTRFMRNRLLRSES